MFRARPTAKKLSLFNKIPRASNITFVTVYVIDDSGSNLTIRPYILYMTQGLGCLRDNESCYVNFKASSRSWLILDDHLYWSILVWKTPWVDRISIFLLLARSWFIATSWRPRARTKCNLNRNVASTILTWQIRKFIVPLASANNENKMALAIFLKKIPAKF